MVFLLWISAAFGLTGLMLLKASQDERAHQGTIEEMRAMVRAYGLTDLCLVTEARYTRHPSMADFHCAFQDHPCALDLFPSGSVIAVPAHLRALPRALERHSTEVLEPAWEAPLGPSRNRGD